ncbi:lipase maturation factor family protein [Shewanella sedimentimangrovi]|uniref:Lipase maturation factor 2 n=1 Tax=Shewanella sedimentimangrovi TaxID=2814293 RepID=A0ABX7R5U5_9GAMM|nr:lipase maturation factor family protein [Shewanella sedimentimangrovi]QSX38166.1 lipase maturation factor family protein [Shewanella sedimentimangrovi]
MNALPLPLLIYDGDCRFCQRWVDYWSRQTAARVRYLPFQELACQEPVQAPGSAPYRQLDQAAFARHIYFFDEDGRQYRGAAAACQVLKRIPGKGFYAWAYMHLPGMGRVSEGVYDWVANHRGLCFSLQKLLLGEHLHPVEYHLTSWLFLRLLALIYLCAFASFHWQAPGLIGHNGLLPLADFIQASHEYLGPQGYWRMPTLFWWADSDDAIRTVTLSGIALSLLLLFNILPRACLILLYLLYLSLLYGGQVFMSFQWDLLLLETGVLALFLEPFYKPQAPIVNRSSLGIWLLRLLLFRFILMSGAVKLFSGDPSWRDLTALQYHLHTQPLPTPLAWYVEQLPALCLQACTALVLVIELLLPWFIFLGRRPRHLAAWGIILLQLGILLTGNYNFFNLLTLVLCLSLFDDRALKNLLPFRWTRSGLTNESRATESNEPKSHAPPSETLLFKTSTWLQGGRYLAGFSLGALGLMQIAQGLGQPLPGMAALQSLLRPWQLASPYGVFAVMTTTRPEILIEGSEDGIHWQAYDLPYKPGDKARPPLWNIPHQPRLDWQLWFAALDSDYPPPWFRMLILRLLFNSPEVLALLQHNPFEGKTPKMVRARLFEYRFTTRQEHAQSGDWWHAREIGTYFPAVQYRIKITPLNGDTPLPESKGDSCNPEC